MIIPTRGKALVFMLHLEHTHIHLPENLKKSELSVAEMAQSINGLTKGTKVLIPTRAGLDIREGDNKYRLINTEDILAVIEGE